MASAEILFCLCWEFVGLFYLSNEPRLLHSNKQRKIGKKKSVNCLWNLWGLKQAGRFLVPMCLHMDSKHVLFLDGAACFACIFSLTPCMPLILRVVLIPKWVCPAYLRQDMQRYRHLHPMHLLQRDAFVCLCLIDGENWAGTECTTLCLFLDSVIVNQQQGMGIYMQQLAIGCRSFLRIGLHVCVEINQKGMASM